MITNMKSVIAALAIGAVSAPCMAAEAGLGTPAVDPAAVSILHKMTSYVRELKGFSVTTQTTLEEVLVSGQRVDLDVAANVTVQRPNKIRAQRMGGQFNQVFYYDGKSLTLFNPDDGVYATQPAPGSIEELLDFARESLGLSIPISDLVYRNAYAILMKGVESAAWMGKVTIDGATCDHLVFSRPDVDFQVWIATGDEPLPCKYVVTDTSTPELVSTVTVTSNWDLSTDVEDTEFEFIPPAGAIPIMFLKAESDSGGK